MFEEHRYRFGVHGKFLAWGFTPRTKEKRKFPKFMLGISNDEYAKTYYAINHLKFM